MMILNKNNVTDAKPIKSCYKSKLAMNPNRIFLLLDFVSRLSLRKLANIFACKKLKADNRFGSKSKSVVVL